MSTRFRCLIVAALGAITVFSCQGIAANICKAGDLTCSTTMPTGGFCQCTSGGNTQDGTVAEDPSTQAHPPRSNASAGGCGDQPNAAGCR